MNHLCTSQLSLKSYVIGMPQSGFSSRQIGANLRRMLILSGSVFTNWVLILHTNACIMNTWQCILQHCAKSPSTMSSSFYRRSIDIKASKYSTQLSHIVNPASSMQMLWQNFAIVQVSSAPQWQHCLTNRQWAATHILHD
jgi:hypothetical protein